MLLISCRQNCNFCRTISAAGQCGTHGIAVMTLRRQNDGALVETGSASPSAVTVAAVRPLIKPGPPLAIPDA